MKDSWTFITFFTNVNSNHIFQKRGQGSFLTPWELKHLSWPLVTNLCPYGLKSLELE